MAERVDTVVIGGGQAGLSISYYLTQQGREHTLLEKNRPGESWRSQKWDTFTLVTPNWHLQLPDFPYQGDNPDGYLTRAEVIQYIDDYIARFDPPLRLGVTAKSVEAVDSEDGFAIRTDAGDLEAANVVIATGTFQKPKIPSFSQQITPDITQIHSSRYRNPDDLPEGGVLVVGSGQSGCQITEEVYQSGKRVYLCTSSVGRAPRRYRGKDFIFWLEKLGVVDETVDDLDSPAERFDPNPHVSGKDGGHTLNLHQFALDGVTLLGRIQDADRSNIELAGDLKENLREADKFANQLKKGVDKWIEASGMEFPEPDRSELTAGFNSEPVTELDLESAGVKTIIWASGYDFDFSWVRFPLWDEFGYPIQERGVSEQSGLYFLGLHWLHTIKSGLFVGIADDAAYIADHIARRS